MADRVPLQVRPGVSSGRIIPAAWPQASGYAWCFGSDEPGRTGYFKPGDMVQMSQGGDLDGARVLRSQLRVRGPAASLPAGWRWVAQLAMGGDVMWMVPVLPRITMDLPRMAVLTVFASGSTTLTFSMVLQGPPGSIPAQELEVPAVYVDNLVLDVDAQQMELVNQYPGPDSVGLPRSSSIRFDVMDPLGAAINTAETRIYLGDELVFDGQQPGINPRFIVEVVPQSGLLTVEVYPQQPFLSAQHLHVRVESETQDGTRTLLSGYSFTTEDFTGPRLAVVQSRAQKLVRVTYSEPVEPSSALQPTAYSVVRTSSPAVAVVAREVVAVTPDTYDVVLDIPITSRASYLMAVVGVQDVHGNPIEAPYNGLSFEGFALPVPARRRFQMLGMVPAMNVAADETEDLRRFLQMLQEPLDLMLYDVDRWPNIFDVDVAEERFLDAMLEGLGNPFRFQLSEVDKRRLLRVLVRMYRQKGTDPGIINTIRFFLGVEVEVVKYISDGWVLGEAELGVETSLVAQTRRGLYSFDVVSPQALSAEQLARIPVIISYVKPGHTHLVRIVEPPGPPEVIDHVELGLSELGTQWILH